MLNNVGRILPFLLFPVPCEAGANTFSKCYIEFCLPESWSCEPENGRWLCQSKDEATKRDAIAVVYAKPQKEGTDDLANYKRYLAKPRTINDSSSIQSKPFFSREMQIFGHRWIDAFQLDSEVPDFYTRYLATVEADLGIAVQFSVRKDKYEDYRPGIEALVRSLRVFQKPGKICEATVAAEKKSSEDPTLPRSFVDRRYENLSPKEQSHMVYLYQEILEAFEKEDFAKMKFLAREILLMVSSFRDTLFYEGLADRELKKIQQVKQRLEAEATIRTSREQLKELIARGDALANEAATNPDSRASLERAIEDIYLLDPQSRKPSEWRK